MSYLPTTKWGDCTRCPSKDVACVKVGKKLVCIPCHRKEKGKEQIDKANERDRRRRNGNPQNAVKKTTSQLRKLYKENDLVIEGKKDYDKLDLWFKERRREMQNVCCECGNKTNRDSDKYYKWSIAHIVPKALIPSVKIDENNWVELCWLHHQEFDSTFDKAAAMQCFGEVKQKFQLFKHKIPQTELRKVNPHFLT